MEKNRMTCNLFG